MTDTTPAPPRCAVLIGPYLSGKTTLLEAMLFAAGATHRKGSVTEGNSVGDSSPEARAREMSVEPNFAHGEYLGDPWFFIDCPGSVELSQDARNALMAADVAILVTEPEPERALTLAPIFHFLADYDIPHMLFVNKVDKHNVHVRDLLEALQAVSQKPLVLRQVPIREDEEITGFVDLASERAWRYSKDKPSERVELPDGIKDREGEARQQMLEFLADYDDELLEQLLEDQVPATKDIYAQLAKDLQADLIVPVLLGSAEHGHGINRLLKALRHEVAGPEKAAERQKIPAGAGFVGSVVKTLHAAHTGKLSVARVWHGSIKEGTTLGGERPSGLYHIMGGEHQKVTSAAAGELVAFGRLEEIHTGNLLTEAGPQSESGIVWPSVKSPVFALGVVPLNRQDEVKLTTSIARLVEEDASLSVEHNASTHQMLLWGQGEIHLRLAVERLKSKYNVEVEIHRPQTAYKETIRKGVQQHARFKRQTGGHGQFGDVHVEIRPLPRGGNFEFNDKIVGGSIPKNYIPAVEKGVKDYMSSGPLGFPVVDVTVTLYDGQYHSVDSSDQAFQTAGRMAMSEGMPKCDPVLLEPICEVTISVPQEFTNKIHGLVSGRRGQILGFEAMEGWSGWDQLKCYMPQAELHDLVVELRSLTLGVGSFDWHFDHLQEFTGKLAEKVIADRKEADAA
jgi:elongation factor G